MGLRCLLGHDFGEPELEREREEEGEQVVVTVREVKRCDRCGESQVVSENTEVTSLDRLTEEANRADRDGTPADAGSADGRIEDDAGSAPGDERGIEAEATTEDAEIIESTTTEQSATTGPDATTGNADVAADNTADPATADATDRATADAADPAGGASADDHGITIEGDVPADGDVDPDAVEEAPPVHETTGTLSPDDDADATAADAPDTDDGAELIDADEDGDGAVGDPGVTAEKTGSSASPSTEPSAVADAEPATSSATDDPDGDHPTDDGVILDDDSGGADDVPDREHGEWPAEERTRASAADSNHDGANAAHGGSDAADASGATDVADEARSEGAGDVGTEDGGGAEADLRTGHSPWPDQRGEDEGFSADADPDAGESVESAVSFEGGLTPEADGPTDYEEAADVLDRPEGADSAVVSGTAGDRGGSSVEDPGITAAREADVAAEPEESTTEYFCPECDLVQPAGRSSMRAGDICPECKRGYIAERPASESA
ncbi:DUF7093 family protein [Halopenitus persicus]|uniref:Uncharacterized protein n=1 Tax=Halopenitus persicus TaxID=1048396 RepID=A0A1H3GD52_9EURY|nr:hypothetical protein [Halopenitus persicus]SDY01272.1 hypothetical protein SAMN05216564_102427 [Halopenitus persicus]